MGASTKTLGIDRLSVAERLTLVEEIWDSLIVDADSPEILHTHVEELDRRLSGREADPGAGSTWEEVKARLADRRRRQAVTDSSAVFDSPTEAEIRAADPTLEGRLEAVEQAVKELRQKVGAQPVTANWLDRFARPFENLEDLEAFDEVVRLGREFRMADRPAEDSGE